MHSPLQVIPLGGLGEIGKNATVLIYRRQAIVIDAGIKFPSESEPGVDYIINDFSLLSRVKPLGLLLTHGHEDHIGGVPYLLERFPMPVYGGRLTVALVRDKLASRKAERGIRLQVVRSGDRIRLGPFDISFFAQTHSIPCALGVFVRSPAGNVLVTGDFKFDQEPVGEKPAYDLLTAFAAEGVDLLLSDSTNAEREGYTPSERSVGRKMREVIRSAPSRVIIATFASNVSRIQQVLEVAEAENRRVLLVGRSMQRTARIAQETGDLRVPEGVLMTPEEVQSVPPERQIILTTGSQGEPFSGLCRMATGTHPDVSVSPNDTVIIAANVIPGNERKVGEAVDLLMRRGVTVHYRGQIHASGHGSQEELRLMLHLTRPRYFMPVHGEYRMLVAHRELAVSTGVPRENIYILDNGDTLEFHRKTGGRLGERVSAEPLYVDGDQVGAVGASVIEDRLQLSEGGVVVVGLAVGASERLLPGFSVIIKGVVERRGSRGLSHQVRQQVQEVIQPEIGKPLDYARLRQKLRARLGSWLQRETGVRPLIELLVTRTEPGSAADPGA